MKEIIPKKRTNETIKYEEGIRMISKRPKYIIKYEEGVRMVSKKVTKRNEEIENNRPYLTNDCLFEIISFLDIKAISSWLRVSKYWLEKILGNESKMIWFNLFQKKANMEIKYVEGVDWRGRYKLNFYSIINKTKCQKITDNIDEIWK
jgi:hypothetical protein